MAHYILLEIDGDAARAQQVHRELAWACVEHTWTPRTPLLALEDEAVVSVSALEHLEERAEQLLDQ